MLALSCLSFLIADVQGGVGPFLAVYLEDSLNWGLNEIGIALATLNIVTVISQIPSGIIIDLVNWKRLLIAISCLFVALGCLLIVNATTLTLVVIAQSIIGIASSIIPSAVTAITLGLVGSKYFPKRISVNSAFNHAGNIYTALITGIFAQWLGINWILYVVVFFCLASLVPLLLIKQNEINNNQARALPKKVSQENKVEQPISLFRLLTQRPFIIFCVAILLFQFSNAAQLPLVGQELGKISPHYASLFMASSIITAQLVMVLVAYALGFILKEARRKPLIMIAFGVLIVRSCFYMVTRNSYILLSVEILDGIASGILGVTAIVIIAELGKNSGRFNFMQGLAAFCVGIGAALSNLVGGYVAQLVGVNISFLTLGLIAIIGMLFFGALMPETKKHVVKSARKPSK
jgi:MFS family permease